MEHEDYIKKRDEIIKRLAIATHEVEPGEDEAENFAEAARAIDALVLEVKGEVPPIEEIVKYSDHLRGKFDARFEIVEIVTGGQS